MLGLKLILILFLHFDGTTGEDTNLFHRSGDEVILPCSSPTVSDSCPNIKWLYYRNTSTKSLSEVNDGKVVQSLPRAARLKVSRNCSLIINNITAEDAGGYRCERASGSTSNVYVLLNVLSISASSPAADPAKEGDVTLQCFLKRYSGVDNCKEKSFRWLDETGTELTGKGDGYDLKRPRSCIYSLTVHRQSITNRRYTCQLFEGNSTQLELHYPAGFKGFSDSSPLSFIMLTLRITVLIMMVGITADIIRTRGSKKPQKDIDVYDAVGDGIVHYENEERSAATTIS